MAGGTLGVWCTPSLIPLRDVLTPLSLSSPASLPWSKSGVKILRLTLTSALFLVPLSTLLQLLTPKTLSPAQTLSYAARSRGLQLLAHPV